MTTRTIQVDVIRIPTKGPGDVSGLLDLIDTGKIDPASIRAVLGKTEGNGGVNDFTREYALAALCEALAPHLRLTPRAVEDKIAFVMSGGTEGVLSPHLTVFARGATQGAAPNGSGTRKRLSIGIAHTRDFLPEEIGRKAQMDETIKAVHAAMADAGIDDRRDVHFVQIKCPLLTSERVEAALHRGSTTVTTSGYSSMGYSRGASALGVAMALGELKTEVREDQVLKDWDLFSSVASSSAGIEIMHNVVIVMGNAAASLSPFVIGHAVMHDSIDLAAVVDALKSVGLSTADAQNGRLVNIFAKAEASPDGCVRGFRHTMLDDSDVGSTRHARAAVGGLVAGLSGTGAVYVSGGAEHQGPPGGGPVAVIARV
jgi:cyanuric acid amidohydrolase